MNRLVNMFAMACLCQMAGASWAWTQEPTASSRCQQLLDKAAAEDKYTFLVFYKDKGPAMQAMAQAVKSGVKTRCERATLAFVNIADGTEKELVDRFGIGRAPMPITVAVAPNGALTKLIPGSISDEQIDQAFVTRVMALCMKSMQEGRLVFICTQANDKAPIPVGVKNFYDDPEFKGRAVVVPVLANDPAEEELIRQMEEDVATKGTTILFLAPPGVLVGKFGPTVTKSQLAEALHKAGQCCEDPNCKHNQAAPSKIQPSTRAARPSQASGTRR